MVLQVSRRSLLGGCAAGVAQFLLTRRLRAAGVLDPATGAPGQLDVSLAALSPRILRISIAPVNAWPVDEELGVVPQPQAVSLLRKPHPAATKVPWGKYQIQVEEDPLRITVADANGTTIQQIQFDADSTAIRFPLGDAPVFGLGEGMPTYDLHGAKDAMRNGQHRPDLRLNGSRIPIPWLMSPAGWGLFIGQPSGSLTYRDLRDCSGRWRRSRPAMCI